MYIYDIYGLFYVVLKRKAQSTCQPLAHTVCVHFPWNSLGVGQSIAVRELVGVLLAKHMAHTRARDNLQGSFAHPHSK